MQIAISTHSLSSDTRAAVAQAAALGFTALEVHIQQTELGYGFRRRANLAFYETLAQEIALRRLTVVALQAPRLTDHQTFSRRARREVLALSGQVAGLLGAPLLVVRPPHLFLSEEALTDYLTGSLAEPPLVEGVEDVSAALADHEVRLALENVAPWHDLPLTNQVTAMARLVEVLDCQVALDVRQALEAQGPEGETGLAPWVEQVGSRVALLRLYDRAEAEDEAGPGPPGPMERRLPPLEPTWRERLPLLRRTAAQACVVEATADPRIHGSLRASRTFWKTLWAA